MHTFEAWVKFPNGTTAHIRLQADNHQQAKQIAEAQYGKENVLGLPSQITGW